MGICRSELVRSTRQLKANRRQAYVVYALQGEVELSLGAESLDLNSESGPIAVVNAGDMATLRPCVDALCVVCTLDAGKLRRLLNDRPLYFVCGPAQRHQAAYDELKRGLDALLAATAETGDFAAFHYETSESMVLRRLIDSFAGTTTSESSRAERFMTYIDAHYDEPITLAQAARFFCLTPEHFSKVFKQEVGSTFHAYLTNMRLEAATDDLCSGSSTISRIALEAGFPNVGSFNRAFRSRYGTTPMQYRNEHAKRQESEVLAPLLRAAREQASASTGLPQKEESINVDVLASHEQLRSSWRDLIGLGSVATLSNARVREQALWLKQHLSFEHWRVRCDFAQHGSEAGHHNLVDCFDFLVGNGFVPHVLIEQRRAVETRAHVDAFAQAMRWFANRYSVQTLRAWRFEAMISDCQEEDSYSDYFELFQGIRRVLEPYGLSGALMGPGIHPDQHCGNLRAFLREAKRRNVPLGSITIVCTPLAPAQAGDDVVLVRTADRYYLRNQVLLARETLDDEGYDPQALLVGGWRDSYENSNIMNDSCYEGASILQTVLSSWDLVGSLCYNDALDLCVEDGAPAKFLCGRPGIVSGDGIPKPSYYALDFLAHINPQLIFANERCLASTNEMGNYQLVCHNCEQLNATYLATPEELLDYRQIDSYYEAAGERLLRFRLTNVRPGTYLIKARFVNALGGSVGDEASRMRLWCMDEPSRSEIEHLKNAAVPQVRLERTLVARDGILSFDWRMQSNEIAYFHLIYLY